MSRSYCYRLTPHSVFPQQRSKVYPFIPFVYTQNQFHAMESHRKGVYGWFGLTQPAFDPDNRFVASPFLPPLVLGVVRLVFATYMSACIIIEPILLRQGRRTRRDADKFPAYFTNITFISLTWFVSPSKITDRIAIFGFQEFILWCTLSQGVRLHVDFLGFFNCYIHSSTPP